MTTRRIALHVLLESGPLPPRPALAICEALADRLQRSPAAAASLHAARVHVGKDGTVEIEGGEAGEEPDSVTALGRLLFQMLMGAPWSEEASGREAQLGSLRQALSGWSGGPQLAALVVDLTQPAPASRPSLAALRDRCLVLQGRIGGLPLRPWLAEFLGGGETPAPLPAVERADEFTAAYPAGMLAAAVAAADHGPVRPHVPDSMPHFVPPLRNDRGDDIAAILQGLAEVPADELGLSDDPPVQRKAKPRKPVIGPAYGFVIGALLALAIAFGWILLG